jgi:hypothetical protein
MLLACGLLLNFSYLARSAKGFSVFAPFFCQFLSPQLMAGDYLRSNLLSQNHDKWDTTSSFSPVVAIIYTF